MQPFPWVSATNTGDPILGDVTALQYVPAISGRPEFFGHWSETLNVGAKSAAFVEALSHLNEPLRARNLMLTQKIRYLVFSQGHDANPGAQYLFSEFFGGAPLPSFLKRVYADPDAEVFEVN